VFFRAVWGWASTSISELMMLEVSSPLSPLNWIVGPVVLVLSEVVVTRISFVVPGLTRTAPVRPVMAPPAPLRVLLSC